jgi:hypothetical protein
MTVVLDHLVYAVPDLAQAVAEFEETTGLRPARGGSHSGLGTANYLVGLGTAYLEIIGPDPAQPGHVGPRTFGVDSHAEARLATWAVRTTDIDATVADAMSNGYDPGPVIAMSRRTPSDELLAWRLTSPDAPRLDGLIPFLIDWGDTAHPSSGDLPQAQLIDFRATHPDPADVHRVLAVLGADLSVATAHDATLHAVLRTQRGERTL